MHKLKGWFAWVQILALGHTLCGIWGKLLDLSVTQFLHNNKTLLLRFDEQNTYEELITMPGIQ